jgi:hypothetical protein
MADMLLLGIESRGKKATGMVSYTPGGKDVVYNKGAVTAKDFIEVRDPIPEGARVVLLHTRLDTKGDPEVNANNHPVICGSTFVVHNGAIHNDDELFEKEKADRVGEVDSEAIAMLLHKLGLDKAEDALAKLEGSFAIAAIDPDKHPDTLLLAKGRHSPLVFHESEKFVVFASTTPAIRDAWKTVLGTPPNYKSFTDAKEGEIFVVTADGVEKKKFEVKERPSQATTPTIRGRFSPGTNAGRSSNAHPLRGSTTPTTGTGSSTARQDRGIVTLVDDRGVEYGRWEGAVKYMRDNKRSKALTWEDYHHKGHSIPAGVDREWYFCPGCRVPVLTRDAQETLSWGRICIDCYAVAIANQPHQKGNPAASLSEEEKRTIENWAVLEANVHRLILDAVSADTGLDTETIDFLIFRVPKEYLQQNPRIAKLSGELDDLYQESSEDAWQTFGVEDAENLQACSVESAPDSKPEQPLALPPGSSRQNDGESTTKHTSAFEGAGSPDLTVKSCRVCKHRSKFHMLAFAWCNKHYEQCGEESCTLYKNTRNSKYPVLAIATDPEGRRLCHYCARSVKGLIYDSQREERGVVLAVREPTNVSL